MINCFKLFITDMQYHILRRKGKSLWGVRLFDAANTAAERRMHRTNRRRLQRRKHTLQVQIKIYSNPFAALCRTLRSGNRSFLVFKIRRVGRLGLLCLSMQIVRLWW